MKLFRLFLTVFMLVMAFKPVLADESKSLNVVVSIQPIHSLVAGVMKGVETPHLLIAGQSNPHHFQLKPSQAAHLSKADLVVWVGPSLESRLVKPLASGVKKGRGFSLLSLDGLTLREMRGDHNHHDHGSDKAKHDDHDDHDHHAKSHDDHKHKEHKHKKHGHDDHKNEKHDEHGHDDHGHDDDKDHAKAEQRKAVDPHIWLDVDNAIVITRAVAARLSKLSPSHASRFEANAQAQIKRLQQLKHTLTTDLSPVSKRAFMVFHDAYQYFSRAFGLSYAGSIATQSEVSPSAKHMRDLKKKLVEENVGCVFSEPQHSDKLVKALIDNSSVKNAQLDPLGAGLAPGPDSYFQMMSKLGQDVSACLASPS